MCTMFGELPSLGLELKVLGDERPVECGHPIGDVVVFLDPGLIVGVVGRELDGCVVVNVVVGVPVA